MKIVIVHRYFWPDTPPYASMLRSIADRLSDDGHDVRVFTSQPSYLDEGAPPKRPRDERLGAVRVRRARLLRERKHQRVRRGVNLGLFALASAAHVLRVRPRVAMAATTPPIVVAVAVSLACRLVGTEFVYHNQDIYPEVMNPDGLSRVGRAVRRVDVATVRRGTRVVVLSDDMSRTQEARAGVTDSVRVINNFDQEVFDPGESSEEGPALEPIASARRIVFGGNVGRFQGVDVLLDAFLAMPRRDGVELHIVGTGTELPLLRTIAAAAGRPDVVFWGQVSPAEASRIVGACDLAAVTLRPGLARYVYPSKTLTYVAAGTPLLAIIEPWSSLARSVESFGIGMQADFEQDAITARLEEFCAMSDGELERVRERVRATHRDLFSRAARLDDWSAMFEELTEP